MKSNNILHSCVILIGLMGSASAQMVSMSVSSPTTPSTDTSYFRCLAWSQDITGLFVTQSELPEPSADNPNPTPGPDFKEEELRIPGAVRSQLYSYLPAKPLKIIRHVQNKILLVSTLDMQSAAHLSLLFFIPSNDASSMNIRVIDDGVDTFPGGGAELFNYSHLSPTFVFETTGGKKTIQLDPGGTKIVPLTFETNSTARVSVWAPGRSTPSFSTAWNVFDTIRYTAFVVDDPNDKSNVQYTRIPDNITNLKHNLDRLQQAKN